MAGNSTTYTNLQLPPVSAQWLNDVNNVVYNLLGSANTFAPTTKNAIVTNLGVTGGGTVVTIGVTSANGFTGTSSGGANPSLTLTTSISGLLKGSGGALVAATNADIPAMA